MEEQELTQFEEIEQAQKKDQFKLFDLYDVSDIKVEDPGMKRYVNLDAKLIVKSQGKIREKFGKAKINLIEIFAKRT